MKKNHRPSKPGSAGATSKNNRPRNAKARPARPLYTGRKRPTQGRLIKIIGLLKDGTYPNCSTVAATFEVSVRSAGRDFDALRDQWEMPIEYDASRRGFYLTKPVNGFPALPLTERELFELCVVQKVIEHYRGTPVQHHLELVLDKIKGRLDDEERFTLQNLDEVLSFRPLAPDAADLALVRLITDALRERRAIEFEYRKPGERTHAVRHVHPYHLMQFSNRWYLLAHDRARGEVRKFVPGRMRNARLTSEHFKRPADFDPRQFFNDSLGVMTGAGDHDVVIELDAWLADVLRGRKWHPSQVWTDLPAGGARLQMHLSCLEEIEQWVLSWGTRATVIQPAALADRIARTAAELLERYRPAGTQTPSAA